MIDLEQIKYDLKKAVPFIIPGFLFVFAHGANGFLLVTSMFGLANLTYGIWFGWLIYLVLLPFPVAAYLICLYFITTISYKYAKRLDIGL